MVAGFFISASLEGSLTSLLGDLGAVLPVLVLVAGFLLAVLAEIGVGKRLPRLVPLVALGSVLAFTGFTAFELVKGEYGTSRFLGMIRYDAWAQYFHLLSGIAGMLAILVSMRARVLRQHRMGMGEYYLLLLAMLIGIAFMAMAQNLLMIYLSIEMVSLPAYVLTAYTRFVRKSAEASLKYVVYGAFASGVMLYAISWLYGLTGSMDLAQLDDLSYFGWHGLLMTGLFLAGIAFKIGVVPFHFWAPDVYEASPWPVAAFFSVAPKAAGFALLVRVTSSLPAEGKLYWGITLFLGILAMASMTLGNLAALRQENLRRMLAYSSIAQAGYLLVGVMVMEPGGYSAMAFYLFIYLFANMGAFLLAGWLEEAMGSGEISAFRGLAQSMPVAVVVTVILMVSLTGLPPTAGFIGKLQLFTAGLDRFSDTGNAFFMLVLVFFLINTVISLFYYLRLPASMIFQNPSIKTEPRLHGFQRLILIMMAIPTIWLGIFSFDVFLNWLREMASLLHG